MMKLKHKYPRVYAALAGLLFATCLFGAGALIVVILTGMSYGHWWAYAAMIAIIFIILATAGALTAFERMQIKGDDKPESPGKNAAPSQEEILAEELKLIRTWAKEAIKAGNMNAADVYEDMARRTEEKLQAQNKTQNHHEKK